MFLCIVLVHEDSSCARVDKRFCFDQFFLRSRNNCFGAKEIIIISSFTEKIYTGGVDVKNEVHAFFD
jgi:hypothetical protein